jgi:hypothetical protein
MGQPNPNGIIPGMKRDDKEPIGYSIVRLTGDSLTKKGSKLFTSTSHHDPTSYNGLGLSQEAIDELNKTRPEGQKLGIDIKTQVAKDDESNPVYQVMPVITSGTNNNSVFQDKTTGINNKPVFQLTVPIYAKIPKIFNDLFPASAIGADGYIDQNQIVYKADTSSDEVDGHYALFYTAYSFLCDDSTKELKDLKELIADTTYKMTKLILKDDNYYVEDATGKATQWSRWMSKYFNDQLSVMEKQVEWKSNVGVYPNGEDALSYGYEDGPLNALEVMATLKTAMTVTKDKYPEDQAFFQKAYDLAYDASSYSKEDPYVNGKGYMDMALEYIKRRIVRQSNDAYNAAGKIVDKFDPAIYGDSIADNSAINATIHNDWTQYINYSDEELGWFPVFELIMQEKDPVRYKQIVDSYSQWYENEVREENPFYTFLYQLANPKDSTVDLESAARYFYRSPQFRIKFPAQYDRQDVFYIEPGVRDKAAQTNYALPLDETSVHKNNANPFGRGTNGVNYTINPDYNYNAGSMDCGTVFTLSYWFGRHFEMIKEVK